MNTELLDMEKLGAAFVLWIVVAIVIEEAGNALFTWKPYKEHLGGKGFKTPIIFITSVLICAFFDIDLFLALVSSVGVSAMSNWLSIGISGLLLAGGSGTAFRTLNRLREAKKKIDNPPT